MWKKEICVFDLLFSAVFVSRIAEAGQDTLQTPEKPLQRYDRSEK